MCDVNSSDVRSSGWGADFGWLRNSSCALVRFGSLIIANRGKPMMASPGGVAWLPICRLCSQPASRMDLSGAREPGYSLLLLGVYCRGLAVTLVTRLLKRVSFKLFKARLRNFSRSHRDRGKLISHCSRACERRRFEDICLSGVRFSKGFEQ